MFAKCSPLRVLSLFLLPPLALPACAQRPEECSKDPKPVLDYKNKECLVGDLHFKFGVPTVEKAKSATAKAVDNGFTFELTVPKDSSDPDPFFISGAEVIPFDVRNFKKGIKRVELSGTVVFLPSPKALGAELDMIPPGSKRVELTLRLGTGAFDRIAAELAPPVGTKDFLKTGYRLTVHRGDPESKFAFTTQFFGEGIESTATQDPEPDAPAACAGKLSDLLGKACETGGLEFAFAKDFDGVDLKADEIVVSPDAKNPGIQLTYPKLKEADSARFKAKVTVKVAKRAITHARLAIGGEGPENVSSSSGVSLQKDKVNLAGGLDTGGIVKVMQGKFASPPGSIEMSWFLSVVTNQGAKPVVASTFVLSR